MKKYSDLAEMLVGSEIVTLGNEINNKIAAGAEIHNFTIGDFSPKEFPIPDTLLNYIIEAYQAGKTNYPPGQGLLALRKSVSSFLKRYESVDYAPEEIQIASGGRPLIFAMFQTIVNPGDKVIYAVPSWNNNHYTNLHRGEHCVIQATAENNFMPKADDLKPYLHDAALLCLCTPQNPTGTTLPKEELNKMCEMIIEENKRRGDGKKLYVLFDQMYFTLTYGDVAHYNPVSITDEMKPYTLMIDGVSKAFAGTGLRVGWACGPKDMIAKMNGFLSHIGAWAPMAEQYAVSQFLDDDAAVSSYLADFKSKVLQRLSYIQSRFEEMKAAGLPVDVIPAQAAIYLTVKVDLIGKKYEGTTLEDQAAVTQFLIDKVGLAIVPFNCFGSEKNSPWYRISVGTSNVDQLKSIFDKMSEVLKTLK